MTRTERALVSSLFAYAQYAISIAISIAIVPMVLARVDLRAYGLWLAASDLLAYVALLDLGIFGVLPWIVAEADGRHDEQAIRRALANAVTVALIVSSAYAFAAVMAWSVFPELLRLDSADRAALAQPLLIVVVAAVVAMPLNVCQATLAGMQDVTFSGLSAIARIVLNASLTIGLLLGGHGLHAVAIGSAVPAVLVGLASIARLAIRFPSLLHGWPRPSPGGMRWLASTAVGAWLGAFGWKLMSMSNGLVLAAIGHPELVPIYSCTARLSTVAVQMGWVIPDSGLIGLAQLAGEGKLKRLRQVTRAMLRLHLIIAGAAMTLLLAVNPAFVSWWVTSSLYGGDRLNVLLAAAVTVGSFTHGLMTITSVLGRRLEVGFATIANGIVHVAAAWLLARTFGVAGLAAAALLAALATALPAGLRMMSGLTGSTAGELSAEVLRWGLRALPAALAAGAVGLIVPASSLWLSAILWLPVAASYVWMMRPMYGDLPLDPRFRTLLARIRLVPAEQPVAIAPELIV